LNQVFPGPLECLPDLPGYAGEQNGQTLDDRFDIGIHHDSLVEFGATVNHAMSDGVDFRFPFKIDDLSS
jgi:hypothetical protein